MKAATVLDEARRRGVVLTAGGDRLRYDGPAESLDDEFIATLAEFKFALLDLLSGRADVPDGACPAPVEWPESLGPAFEQRVAWRIAQGLPRERAERLSFREMDWIASGLVRAREASDTLPWRSELAGWPVPWREQWGRRTNALEASGFDWRTAESRAFDEVRAEKEHPESIESGDPDPAGCSGGRTPANPSGRASRRPGR